MRFQPLSRLCAPGLRVLDRLRLVEDDHAPVDLRQPIRLLMQEPVAEHQHVHRLQAGQNLGPAARRAEAPDREAGGEAGQLVFPVVTDRRRRDHQTGAVRRLFQHGRDGLDGLAQAHVVGETGPRLPMRQPRQPAKPLELVIAQFRLQRRRRLRAGAARRRSGARRSAFHSLSALILPASSARSCAATPARIGTRRPLP